MVMWIGASDIFSLEHCNLFTPQASCLIPVLVLSFTSNHVSTSIGIECMGYLGQQAIISIYMRQTQMVFFLCKQGNFPYVTLITTTSMSTSGLKSIAPVPTAADFLDIVLSKTQRKTPTVRVIITSRIRPKLTLTNRSSTRTSKSPGYATFTCAKSDSHRIHSTKSSVPF